MTYSTLSTQTLKHKRVLIREDLNVPLDDAGNITSDQRILAALPTIKATIEQEASVMLLSHLGRPTEGIFDEKYSLAPVAKRLSELLNQPVRLIKDYLEQPVILEPGEVVLFENVRFNIGEKHNDEALSKKLALLCDIFVMDAFATAHRQHASTYGVAQYASIACAGMLLASELNALENILKHPKPPLVAIVGGAKVSTKLTLLKSLIEKVDHLILGGGIANTFIAAQDLPIGDSLYEPAFVEEAKLLLQTANQTTEKIVLPTDVMVAKQFHQQAKGIRKSAQDITADDKILDVGSQTAHHFAKLIMQAGTVLWNGPLGVFEFDHFSKGTETLALAIAQSNAYSVAGGGDTLAAIEKYGIADKISYISTGGGAFLTYLESGTLPALEVLS